MLLEILQFLFFLSEVDADSCFTLRKTIFKREPLQLHLPNDAKMHEINKYSSFVFQKVLCFSRSIMFFEKIFEKFRMFREVF
jgi:hypothetical protein